MKDPYFREPNADYRFKEGDIAVVLGDAADWEHPIPPLHYVTIIDTIRGQDSSYPLYDMPDVEGVDKTGMDLGYQVEMVACSCDKQVIAHPMDRGVWDVALCDLGISTPKPVTEEEMQEVYRSLGVVSP